ncbi:MAG TPA: polysaccharide biosynthesis/export family protein [Candidatus Polarisedimenticolaceae bacterium]|nr:polysaccharide biosynthesis/export family protein [Candidatus Polarisedimenticolaceae bacterium]
MKSAFHFRTLVLPALAGACLLLGPARAEEGGANSSEDYVLGVEDHLSISVWNEPQLSNATRVIIIRPDGKITFPLVGDIQAAGRTPKQLTDDLTTQLTKKIKDPTVTVTVDEINSFKVAVVGEVTTQGVLTLRRRTRLLEAIALSGGLSQYADKSNVVLVRFDNGKENRTRVDYRKVLSGERPELNMFLKPGDILIVN